MSVDRYVCIHGHFYQPPRENPWLEEVEVQDSAFPYHDWNERITAECYSPNRASRVLDKEGMIGAIVNNYKALLDRNPQASRQEIVEALSGNICRCTGYEPIIQAIQLAAKNMIGNGSKGA